MMSEAVSFEVVPLRNSNVQYVYSRKNEIDFAPSYQRQSEVWTKEKRQLLIDSLLNGFDIPTIYLHQYNPPQRRDGKTYRWALVDGKQRLEAIFGFLDGAFTLSSDFKLFSEPDVKAAGLTKSDLDRDFPLLSSDLLATALDVKEIRTKDLDLIEELFSRLNEAVPLNAAEKRNAFGGPLPGAVRDLVLHRFFKEKLPFDNRRYRHYDLAAKFLYLTESEPRDSQDVGPVRDLKKIRLDRFFTDLKKDPDGRALTKKYAEATTQVLDLMSEVFTVKDQLLNVGMATVYFLLFRQRMAQANGIPGRSALMAFNEFRRVEPKGDESELSRSDIVLMEFGRFSQSPNDGSALTYRLAVLRCFLSARQDNRDPVEAIATLYDASPRKAS